MKGSWELERVNTILVLKIIEKENLENYMVIGFMSAHEKIMDQILQVIYWKNKNMIEHRWPGLR